jgi:HTH-type transcriptional regulator/antitoxin HigA
LNSHGQGGVKASHVLSRRGFATTKRANQCHRFTPEGDRLDVLVTLVEAWEAKHYPLDLPDAVEAIKYHMEQGALPRAT